MPALQKIRGILFYFSVLIFFIGLPFILTFALGYKFNLHNFKFVKTGLIYVKTQPPGANIYLNGRLIDERSPASMQELLPGTYKVALELAEHYPWKGQVEVEAGKVSRVDKVILFPQRPDLKQLNRAGFRAFRIDAERKQAYYLDEDKKIIYRSNLDASNFEDIASLPDKFSQINGWDISSDRKKLFIFNYRQIGVVVFDNLLDYEHPASPVLLDYPQEKVLDVFWHSDSYHLVVVTDKHVQVVESRANAQPVNLIELNKAQAKAFYDAREDVLYFSDSQRGPDGSYNNLYKLELSADLYFLERLITQPFGQAQPTAKEGSGE